MPTKQEITIDFQAQHDALEALFYTETPTLTKEQFDTQHGQLWDDYFAELVLYGHADPDRSPATTFWAIVAGFRSDPKPIQVTRTWDGDDFTFWCYCSQYMFDLYQATDLAIGDRVLLSFVERDKTKAVVTAKVYEP